MSSDLNSNLNNGKHKQRTVIVTGASSGIGLELVRAYRARGFNVVGNARSAAGLERAQVQLGNSPHFVGVAGDVALPETGRHLVDVAREHFGGVDVLINNAGFFLAKPFIEYSADDLDSLLATNLKGVVFASQAAAAHMIERGGGHIVNITTSLALQPQQSVSAALQILIKGGINQMTRALAIELSPHRIQVNAVAPGIIDTPMHTPDSHAFLNTLQPGGKLGTVADIAEAVLYLTDSKFTSGVILPVDGAAAAGRW